VGLHTGKETRIRVKPAPQNTGVVFIRSDLPDQPQIPVHVDYVDDTRRRTSLRNGEALVHTIEHLFAVLNVLRLDNLEIEIDSDEIPGMDGSAAPFFEALQAAGAVEQKSQRKVCEITTPIVVDENGCSLTALPPSDAGGEMSLSYMLDFRGSGIASQYLDYTVSEETFSGEIAPARTFCFEQEAEELLLAGFGKGANHQNTLVIRDGQIVENELRFSDEFARHKILDLTGDLFLINADLSAHIIAVRSGHRDNIKLVRKIVDEIEMREMAGSTGVDSGMDIQEVFSLLPHRYPFLLIDRVIELEGYRRAVGIKNVTINEPFFQGHFPGQPIMPGVLILEAMAQLAGVLLLRRLENTGKLAVLWSIDKVKLRKSVIPGDQLRIEIEATKVKDQMGRVQAKAKVSQKLVAEALLTFTLVDAT